ncbi:MFS general substrate transporter [Terfezia boudieri ATCC MYA-4762]|uniref:MFS general substrate transporter n=1 Tax=Terfezia boudieri ATCC MYA-4762 TaxID=1051890 RepID=A0A3N4LXZ4_9PEZI|nr:MFS general substrate transporter [Terfezia boudieri ATCC MYA-4762]
MDSRTNTLHYQTFPTKPPSGKGRPPGFGTPRSRRASFSSRQSSGVRGRWEDDDAVSIAEDVDFLGNGNDGNGRKSCASAPTRQLAVLAILSLAEQTALNSISPYLPHMTASFPGIDSTKVGLYVGVIASSFAAAQVATNFFWGRLSDRIGRKPVILFGTLGTAAGFLAFGYVKNLWQAAVVQAFIGVVNGNAGVVSTVLGEITDKHNQGSSFAYLPMVYGLGSILGPIMGGLLAGPPSLMVSKQYPFLLPNLVSTVILLVDFAISMFYLEESLEQAQELPPLGTRVQNLFFWLWQFTAGAAKPSYLRGKFENHRRKGPQATCTNHQHRHHKHTVQDCPHNAHHPSAISRRSSTAIGSPPRLFPRSRSLSRNSAEEEFKEIILTPSILLLLAAYFVFNLSNITFSSLYPIFVSTSPPTGRGLSPREIGLTLSFTGVAAILFQICAGIGTNITDKIGNKNGFQLAMVGMVASFFLMPLTWSEGKWLMYGSISGVLLIKSIANVLGFTSALILVTNASPDKSVLGRINGLAQTLAAAGRAVGPFLSGGLWSLAVKEGGGRRAGWLTWGGFGGVAVVGVGLAMGIRGGQMETEGDEEEVSSYVPTILNNKDHLYFHSPVAVSSQSP